MQADGWLTLPVLSAPISAVLAQWVGGRALRLLGLTLSVLIRRLTSTGGRETPDLEVLFPVVPVLAPLVVAVRLELVLVLGVVVPGPCFLFAVPTKLGNLTMALDVRNMVLFLAGLVGVDRCIAVAELAVLVTR